MCGADQSLPIGWFIGAWRWLVPEDRVTASPEVATLYGVHIAAAGHGLAFDQFAAAVHPDDQLLVRAGIEAARNAGGSLNLSYRLMDQESVVRHVTCIGACVRYEGGRPIEFLGGVHLVELDRDPIGLAVDHLMSAARAIRLTDQVMLTKLIDMAMLEAGLCLGRSASGTCIPMRRAV